MCYRTLRFAFLNKSSEGLCELPHTCFARIMDVQYYTRKRPYQPSGPIQSYKRRKSQPVARRSSRAIRRIRESPLGVEKKYYDSSLNGSTIAANTDCTGGEYDPSTTNMITTPPVGDGEQSRDGKQIVCKSVVIKGTIAKAALTNQTALALPTEVFLAVVLDTQSNAAQMNSEDCFINGSTAAVTLATPLRNLLFSRRFKILKSDCFKLEPKMASWDGTNIEIAGDMVSFDWYIPMRDLKINFNAGTTASIANVVDNSVHVIAFATNATTTLSYNARLRYLG